MVPKFNGFFSWFLAWNTLEIFFIKISDGSPAITPKKAPKITLPNSLMRIFI
jgi:hypothetical protein